mgnify:CR=1 FL=1|jgi:hypothetical protein
MPHKCASLAQLLAAMLCSAASFDPLAAVTEDLT